MSSMYPSARLCQRCGRALTPSEVYCNTCGQYNSPAPAGGSTVGTPPPPGISWGGPSPQTNYGGGQSAGQQWGQIPSSTAPDNPFGGGFAPQPTYSGNSYAQQPFFHSAPPPAPAMGFQQDIMNGYSPAGYSQPPRKGGPNIGLIIGIIILLLVLVGGGFFGYRYITNHNSKATITPAAAPSATPSKPPLFSDSFQDNKNGWDLTSITGKFSVKVGGGSMVLEDDNNKLLYELLPGGKTYGNFQLNVDGQLSKGDQNNGYGIFIRGASNQNSDLATFYRFELYGDGTYAVFKGTVDANGKSQSSKLVGYPSNAAIQKVGKVNHITIIAKGPSMSFIVNGQTLTTITDNSYTSGSAALFVSNLPAPTPPVAQATFNNLAIYPI
jgi:3-keto-disaccharide hydrolase